MCNLTPPKMAALISCDFPSMADRKRRRRVRFAQPEASSNVCPWTPEEVKAAWLSTSDITKFRVGARNIVLSSNPCKDETRGLERYDLGRSREKVLYAKLIVKATKKFSSEQVATMAHKLSTKTREHAAILACKDYCEVHAPHLLHLIPAEATAICCKRPLPTPAVGLVMPLLPERRVRARLA